MSSFDNETELVALEAFEEGKNYGKQSSQIQGANMGIINGSLVGYDVGYWKGLSSELNKLLKDEEERKLVTIRKCCTSVEKVADSVPLDTKDESITDKLKELKERETFYT